MIVVNNIKISEVFKLIFKSEKVLLALILILLAGCNKDKMDFQPDYTNPDDQGPLSKVRIINSVEYGQVTANGEALTNFLPRNPVTVVTPYVVPGGSYWAEGLPGTTYFPINGYLGREWVVPNALFQRNNRLDLFFSDGLGFGSIEKMGITLTNPDESVDYYLGYYDGSGKDTYFKVNRSDSEPKEKSHFKIRVINLSSTVELISNPSGSFKDLKGAVSLLYADGTPVDPKTSGVSLDKRVSDYVELPFGKYQFKMNSDKNLPIPGTDGNLFDITIDPSTASIDIGKMKGTHIVHSPIHSFKPGASYTILVYPFKFIIYTRISPVPMKAMYFQNGFRIIQDYEPEAEVNFLRAQAFNAFEKPVNILVNGKKLTSDLEFGKSTDYQVFESGEAKIEITDNSGKVLQTKTENLNRNQNYTIWTYPNVNNELQVAIVSNDLSGERQLGLVEDGTIGREVNTFPYSHRYLNFCPDIPYLTFTADNGRLLNSDQTKNLRPGNNQEIYPNVWGSILELPYNLYAFSSKPDQLPGVWLNEISPLKSTDFIANKDYYNALNWEYPIQEPGYYTVALIGRFGKDVPKEFQARLVKLKHNK